MGNRRHITLIGTLAAICLVGVAAGQVTGEKSMKQEPQHFGFDRVISENTQQMLENGREIFRFDTFGDEAFWGDTLNLHQAIEGAKLGGVSQGVSPKTALSVG